MPAETTYRKRRNAGRCAWCTRGVWPPGPALCDRCRPRARKASREYRKRTGKVGGWKGRWFDPANRREVYEAKKLAGLCVSQGCLRDALDDNVHCRKHRASSRKRAREYQARKRAKATLRVLPDVLARAPVGSSHV